MISKVNNGYFIKFCGFCTFIVPYKFININFNRWFNFCIGVDPWHIEVTDEKYLCSELKIKIQKPEEC